MSFPDLQRTGPGLSGRGDGVSGLRGRGGGGGGLPLCGGGTDGDSRVLRDLRRGRDRGSVRRRQSDEDRGHHPLGLGGGSHGAKERGTHTHTHTQYYTQLKFHLIFRNNVFK